MTHGSLWKKVPEPWRTRLDRLARAAREQDTPCAVVGGCVRDLILDAPTKDWDVVVQGLAGPLVRSLALDENAAVREHSTFRTYTLTFPDGTSLDVATARTETYPSSGALPLVRPATLEEDPVRRDFTVNALYLRLWPREGELWDPLQGLPDLDKGFVRVLHHASFIDDPTRVFRAARYAGRFGWTLEPDTLSHVQRALREDRPAALSPVRLRNELFHLLREKDPVPGLRLLWDWGAWRYWDKDWTWKEDLSPKLRTSSEADPLPPRLAALLAESPGSPEAWLRRHDTPAPLRRRVLNQITAPPSSP